MPVDPRFARQLKQVLAHLYDYAYVQKHPFSQWFDESHQPGVSRSQLLRRIILDAIEQLNPGLRFSPRSPEARSYQILVQRFVEGKSPREVSEELGIVERQLFRDQRQAISADVNASEAEHHRIAAVGKAGAWARIFRVFRFGRLGNTAANRSGAYR